MLVQSLLVSTAADLEMSSSLHYHLHHHHHHLSSPRYANSAAGTAGCWPMSRRGWLATAAVCLLCLGLLLAPVTPHAPVAARQRPLCSIVPRPCCCLRWSPPALHARTTTSPCCLALASPRVWQGWAPASSVRPTTVAQSSSRSVDAEVWPGSHLPTQTRHRRRRSQTGASPMHSLHQRPQHQLQRWR